MSVLRLPSTYVDVCVYVKVITAVRNNNAAEESCVEQSFSNTGTKFRKAS